MIAPSLVDPKVVKYVFIVPTIEKGQSIVTVMGFHKISNPPDALEDLVCMESHPRQLQWKIVYASDLAHFVSCSRSTYGFSVFI